MASNSSIDLVGLDFDTLKENLKNFLRSQTAFADYDFDGSNMSVLVDLLAYNSYQMSFYLNMVASESFLDSAQMRNSVVSHAKELNYVPRSARSAKATVSLAFDADTNIVTIPKGTSFTSLVGYNLYTFITEEETVYFSSNNSFIIDNLDIYEGQLVSDQFIVNYEDPTQRFVITDPNVDTRSIGVTVFEDGAEEGDEYTPASSTLGLDGRSLVFFLQGAEDGKYELIFGDNIIGRRPLDSSIISVSYRTCNREDANGAAAFQLDTAFANFTSTPSLALVDLARGGSSPETVESIKFYAPRHFQTQERAVNTSDYEIILQQRFPEINAISAYGGEEINPPQYGRVYISVDISNVDGLPDAKVQEYKNFIKPRSPLSIDAIFVEPDYTYYTVKSHVKCNVNETNLSFEQIKSLIVNKIVTYDSTYLDDFKVLFRYSKFVGEIDSITGAGIVSNDTEVNVYKKFAPTFSTPMTFNLNFNMPLLSTVAPLDTTYGSNIITAIRSSSFVLNGESVHIQDDGNGTLRVVKTSGDENITVVSSVGTVDYTTGAISFNGLTVSGLGSGITTMKVYAITESKDFQVSGNVILSLESDEIDVQIEAVRDGSSSNQVRQRI